MPCSCQTSQRRVAMSPVLPMPHEVLPDESCIFCAGKHVDTAYSELLSGGPRNLVIGELELARRHTLLEFPAASAALAEAEYLACLRDERLATALSKAVDAVQTEMSRHDGMKKSEGRRLSESAPMAEPCPFIGEVHMCAAWRLASEVGYMLKNRAMIIGDLAMAREHLSHFDSSVQAGLRELRHRVQNARASDLDIYWPYIVNGISRLVNDHMKEWKPLYAMGLAERLKVVDMVSGETR